MQTKVIFANRRGSVNSSVGDVVQMLKTKEYLENMFGYDVTVAYSGKQISQSDARIVHIFNIQTIDETLCFIEAAKHSGKLVALSPIYWDLSHANMIAVLHKYRLLQYARIFKPFRSLLATMQDTKQIIMRGSSLTAKRRRSIMAADLILPNSHEEMDILAKVLSLDINHLRRKTRVVPNGIDRTLINDYSGHALVDATDYVLCVGSYHPIKNQLCLIKALYDRKDIPIVLVGPIVSRRYFDAVSRLGEARGNVYILGQLEHARVYSLYKRAKVHVLASFRESPGLATLEALASGCEVVVSGPEYCPHRYYEYDRYAHICDPYNVRSIRHAILESYENRKNKDSVRYQQKHCYEVVADETSKAYRYLLSTCSSQ